MLTLIELKQRMAEQLNPDELVEILEISSEELVEAFYDKIEERFDHFQGEYGDSEIEETESEISSR